MKAVALSLLQSQKFWLTLIPMVSAVAMYARHGISAEQLSQALSAGFGILVLALAHEQNGTNQAATNVATTGDVTVSPSTSESEKVK